MKRFWKTSVFCAVAAFLSLTAGSINAHVIYFSEQGPADLVLSDPGDEFSPRVVAGGLTENTVPTINMNVDDSRQLHVWINFDNPLTVAQRRTLSSLAFDIVASADNALIANSFTMANPENLDEGTTRWDGVVDGTLNDTASRLVYNARAAAVASPGIGSHPSLFDLDQGHDDVTGGAYLGTLDFRALAGGTYGLYFRTGELKTIFANQTSHPIQYGDELGPVHQGNVVGSGDPIDPGLTLADAIIIVAGGPMRTDLVLIGDDPTGATHTVMFEGRRPVDVPIGGPSAVIAIDNAFYTGVDSFFDVFVDVEIAQDANTDLAGLIAMLEGQGLDVEPGRTLPSGPNGEDMEYDFALRLTELGASGQTVLDIDFSANGVVGVSINSVAVPEPSTFALAALGCVVLVGLRRRKIA